MSQIIDLLIKNGSCFIDGKIEKVDLALNNSKITEIGKLKKELYEIISVHSGQKYDKVHSDSDRDYWMKAQEAKKYGMIDEVLKKK